jgi:hypothetical protein
MEAQLGIRGVLLETMLGPALHVEAKGPAVTSEQNLQDAELLVIRQSTPNSQAKWPLATFLGTRLSKGANL